MSENKEDLKFILPEDSVVVHYLKSDKDDSFKQIIVSDLISIKKEEPNEDSSQFTDTVVIVKEEPMLVEAVKTKTESKPRLEESDFSEDTVKTEEIDIKTEDEEDNIENSTSSNHVIPKKYEDTAAGTGQLLSGTKRKPNLRRSRLRKSYKGKTVLKCTLCNFGTIWPASLKRHLGIHRYPEDQEWFQCSSCNYRSIEEDRLRRHVLIHKKSQLKKFQCAHCDYQTIYKASLKCHMLIHISPGEREWFQCSHCNFQTLRKNYLRDHELMHEKSELEWFRCYHCDYETIRKRYLIKHFIVHKNNDKVDRVRCDKCNDTIHKNNFMIHKLKHKSPSGDEWFQCSHCDFRTVQKNCLRAHSLIHKKSEVEKF